ncbi:MAG: alanine:cation symporter family protein, partial [Halieaceae bacterium]
SQGLVQALSVFIDTILLCTCTALIILLSPIYQPGSEGVEGIAMTQLALASHIGPIGEQIVSIALVMFAVSSIAYNCYLGENSIAYFDSAPRYAIPAFRVVVLALIFWASQQDLATVFSFSDLTMGLLAVVNLIALWFLFPVAKRLLHHYETRLEGAGPINFQASDLPEEDLDSMSWTAAETSR